VGSTGNGGTPLGSFVPTVSVDTTNGTHSSGTEAFTYTVSDAALDSIRTSVAQTILEQWRLELSDGHGSTLIKPATIKVDIIIPADIAPTLVAGTQTGVIAELTNTTGSTALDQASGSIGFIDTHASDLPTALITTLSALYTNAVRPSCRARDRPCRHWRTQ
jgi:hypothetical protein